MNREHVLTQDNALTGGNARTRDNAQTGDHARTGDNAQTGKYVLTIENLRFFQFTLSLASLISLSEGTICSSDEKFHRELRGSTVISKSPSETSL